MPLDRIELSKGLAAVMLAGYYFGSLGGVVPYDENVMMALVAIAAGAVFGDAARGRFGSGNGE